MPYKTSLSQRRYPFFMGGSNMPSPADSKKVTYKRFAEHPEVAQLAFAHSLPEEKFNFYLDLLKRNEPVPDLSIHSKDLDAKLQDYHFVKLSIENCIFGLLQNKFPQEIKEEVEGSLSLNSACIYVFLERKKDATNQSNPLLKGKVNYSDFNIVSARRIYRARSGNLIIGDYSCSEPKNQIKDLLIKEWSRKITQLNESKTIRVVGESALNGLLVDLIEDNDPLEVPDELDDCGFPMQLNLFFDANLQGTIFVNQARRQKILSDLTQAIHKIASQLTQPVPADRLKNLIRYLEFNCYSELDAKSILTHLSPNNLSRLMALNIDFGASHSTAISWFAIAQLMQHDLLTMENYSCLKSITAEKRGESNLRKEPIKDLVYSECLAIAMGKIKAAGFAIDDIIRDNLRDWDMRRVLNKFIDTLSLLKNENILDDPFIKRKALSSAYSKETALFYIMLKNAGLEKDSQLLELFFGDEFNIHRLFKSYKDSHDRAVYKFWIIEDTSIFNLLKDAKIAKGHPLWKQVVNKVAFHVTNVLKGKEDYHDARKEIELFTRDQIQGQTAMLSLQRHMIFSTEMNSREGSVSVNDKTDEKKPTHVGRYPSPVNNHLTG